MYTINYYSIRGLPRGGLVKGNVGWAAALADLRKAPRAARIAEIIIGDEIRRYERNEKNGWRRTV